MMSPDKLFYKGFERTSALAMVLSKRLGLIFLGRQGVPVKSTKLSCEGNKADLRPSLTGPCSDR